MFIFNDTATTEIYTLSLHDALPISEPRGANAGFAATAGQRRDSGSQRRDNSAPGVGGHHRRGCGVRILPAAIQARRSEEHTSELQSHLNLVCRLLLEKKKTNPSPNA